MTKDYLRGQGYVKAPKIEKELGVGKDGYQQGGIPVEMTNPDESQVVDVKGTRRMRPDKKPVKATWYQFMWLQAIKLAAQAGSKIYANRQRAKSKYIVQQDIKKMHGDDSFHIQPSHIYSIPVSTKCEIHRGKYYSD